MMNYCCYKRERERDLNHYKIGDLFDVLNGKRLTKSDIISGSIPYISSSSYNNGIQEYIANDDGAIYSDCLSIAYNGKESAVFYHSYKAVFSDNVRVVKVRNGKSDKNSYLYLATVFKKVRERFNYGNPMSSEKLRNENIKLPTKNNQIDFEYMTTFIKAVQKLIIKDLMLYTERELKAYEQIII